jgi:DNA-binding GntR family transcriptional regulator
VLLRSWDYLGFELQTRVHLSRNREGITTNASAHFAIVDALEKGDGDSAGRLLKAHSLSFVNDD